MTTTDGRNTVA